MKTQAEQVVNHLAKYGSITSVEAIGLYSITRLAAVIHRLNKQGFPTFASYADNRVATYFVDKEKLTKNLVRAALGEELITS